MTWDANTNTGLMRSAPSTNTYCVLVAEIEEFLNSEDKEYLFFGATLLLDYKEDGNED